MKCVIACSVFLLGFVFISPTSADESSYSEYYGNGYYYDPSAYQNLPRDDKEEGEDGGKEIAPWTRSDGYFIAMILILFGILLQLIDGTVLSPIVTPVSNPIGAFVSTPIGLILTALLSPIVQPLTALAAIIETTIAAKTGRRSLNLEDTTKISSESLNMISQMVLSVIESEECISRIVCHTGGVAAGKEAFIKITEKLLPKQFSTQWKVFKESAYGTKKCIGYKCKKLDWLKTVFKRMWI